MLPGRDAIETAVLQDLEGSSGELPAAETSTATELAPGQEASPTATATETAVLPPAVPSTTPTASGAADEGIDYKPWSGVLTQLQAANVSPERLDQVLQEYLHLQSPEGAQAFMKRHFNHEQYVSALVSNPQAAAILRKRLGMSSEEVQPEEEIDPQARELRDLKSKLSALEQRIGVADANAGKAVKALSDQEQSQAWASEYKGWFKQRPGAARFAEALLGDVNERLAITPDAFRAPGALARYAQQRLDTYSKHAGNAGRPPAAPTPKAGAPGVSEKPPTAAGKTFDDMATEFVRHEDERRAAR